MKIEALNSMRKDSSSPSCPPSSQEPTAVFKSASREPLQLLFPPFTNRRQSLDQSPRVFLPFCVPIQPRTLGAAFCFAFSDHSCIITGKITKIANTPRSLCRTAVLAEPYRRDCSIFRQPENVHQLVAGSSASSCRTEDAHDISW